MAIKLSLLTRTMDHAGKEQTPPKKISAIRLQSPPQVSKVSKMTALLHPHHWLSCDEIDFASYLFTKENPHIDGYLSTLLFSVLHNGGIVDTPSNQFV